jgi:hypothetical protein
VGVLVVVAAACAVWPMRVMTLSIVASRCAVSVMGVMTDGGFPEEFQKIAFEGVVRSAGVACCRFDDLQRNF